MKTKAGNDVPDMRVEVIELRADVKARDLRVLDGVVGGVACGLALIAQLGGLQRIQVDELSVVDFAALSEIVMGFMPPGLRIGETA